MGSQTSTTRQHAFNDTYRSGIPGRHNNAMRRPKDADSLDNFTRKAPREACAEVDSGERPPISAILK